MRVVSHARGATPWAVPIGPAMGQPNPAPPTNPPADPGATPPANPPTDPTAPPATGDDDTAAKLKKLRGDLDRERSERHSLQNQLKELEGLRPLEPLAKALGVKAEQGKTELQTLTDQFQAMQAEVATERAGRIRAEVAAAKKLPPALAAVLKGTTAEEMTAHADELLAALPGIAQGNGSTPGTPAPDPSQGARGGTTELESALKAAQDKGDTREVIRLRTAIAAQRART